MAITGARGRYAAGALLTVGWCVLALGLAGCTNPNDEPAPAASPQPAPSPGVSAPGSSSPGGTDGPTGTPSGSPSGSSPGSGPLEATPDLLTWRPVDGASPGATVTTNAKWSLAVSKDQTSFTLDGPKGSSSAGSGSPDASGPRISDALLDDHWAVVVRTDEAGRRPSTAEVTPLGSGRSFAIDGSSDVPTTNGGTWALGQDTILHATRQKQAYCLATFSLESGASSVSYCAPSGTGFSSAHVTPAGVSLLTFDDAQPSCRTVVSVQGDTAVPFPGVTRCKGAEGVLLGTVGAPSWVWAEVSNPNRYERSRLRARVGSRSYDLGSGTTGTLTECDGAAYFVRDSQTDTGRADLLRFSIDDAGAGQLSLVYESPSGPAFLTAPRCAGTHLTLTAMAEGGDEQVTTALR